MRNWKVWGHFRDFFPIKVSNPTKNWLFHTSFNFGTPCPAAASKMLCKKTNIKKTNMNSIRFSCSAGEDCGLAPKQELHLRLSPTWHHERRSICHLRCRYLQVHGGVSWRQTHLGGTGGTFHDTNFKGVHHEWR